MLPLLVLGRVLARFLERRDLSDSKLVGFFWRGGPDGKFTTPGAGWGGVVDTFEKAKSGAEEFESQRAAEPPKKVRKLKIKYVDERGST